MGRLLAYLIVAPLVLGCFPADAQSQGELNELFSSYFRNGLFSGVVLIAQGGEAIYQRAEGMATQTASLDMHTPMPMSSLTKSFTAMAIMILEERKLIAPEDAVTKFIPEINYPAVRIEHLIHHTAGFKRLAGRIGKSTILETEDVVEYLAAVQPKLSFPPGTQFQYSNIGYTLLARVVEVVSGKPYFQFIDEEIFQPLEMEDAFILHRSNWRRNRAVSFNQKGREDDWMLGSYTGAVGAYASAIDLLKFDRGLYSEKILTQKSIKKKYGKGRLQDGREVNYARGWRHWEDDPSLIFQNGDWTANESMLFRDIKNKNTIIILSNRKNDVTKWELMNEVLPLLGYHF